MSSAGRSKVVAGNAINTLSVAGWAKTTRGFPVVIEFTRQEVSPVEPSRAWRGEVLPNGPPARLPSKLPAPGAYALAVSLDKCLGDGRCGTTFAVETLQLSASKGSSQKIRNPQFPYFPDLALKVASGERVKGLQNEAAIYDEMESLQGISVPRCYGLFTAELGPNIAIPSDKTSPTSDHPRQISILLLERVGEALPLGNNLPEEGDLWDVFRDLARLGIEQTDIRYSDILQAPRSGTSFPGGICPFHKTVHHYRVIDFDSARKTDLTLKRHYFSTAALLGPILEGVKQNVVVEPRDIAAHRDADRPTAL